MEAVGQLAGGVAHDFNNLLTVIAGYGELVMERLPIGDPGREDLAEVLLASKRAADLTHQLLAFSRKQVLEPKVIDLNVVVAGMDRMLRPLIGEAVELVTRLQPNLGRVLADPGQLEQVIMNLAINARDAMPQGGKITIETRQLELDDEYARIHPDVAPGSYVMLALSDTGTEMTPEVLARVFEPFFTTKAQGKGTGLGLSTTFGIVKQSGGHIWPYSEIGAGTTFKVYLPSVDRPIGVSVGVAAPRVTTGRETILLAEDDDVLRRYVRGVLESYGYSVLAAKNGVDALSDARRHEGLIELLVTDVVMPQMGGRELADRLRAERPTVAVLYLSGYTENAIVHRGQLDPGIEFLPKPFTREALAAKVRAVLDARKS